MQDFILSEAKRLHALGFAVHWLMPKSKRPIESGWTTGPRAEWDYLKETYQKGMNVGVRLGTASKIKNHFLAVIDVDIKSSDPKHRKEVVNHLRDVLGESNYPIVLSGRGNASRHYYILTAKPAKPLKIITSKEIVKVAMPSAKPSKKELQSLSDAEIKEGTRLRPAFEIAIMGEGQQVVLPPSIHPDSGRAYAWKRPFAKATKEMLFDLGGVKAEQKEAHVEKSVGIGDIEFQTVDLAWLPLSSEMKEIILHGKGVEDRSATLLSACHALVKAGLSKDEVLSVLTDDSNFLGPAAFEHAKTTNRMRAAQWVWKYTAEKVFRETAAANIFKEPLPELIVLSTEEREADEALAVKVKHWSEDLDCTDKGKYRATLKNIEIILENKIGKNLFKRDTFSFRDMYGCDTPWGKKTGQLLADEDVSAIKSWLSRNYSIEPSSALIIDAMNVITQKNQYDPVKDMLEALPEWDGINRTDTWLKDHFEAEGNEDYLAQVFRKWLCAMVYRIYEPGAKFDWMPIFEGLEGVGKSSFGNILAGDTYFTDWLPDLADKDAALQLQGRWVVEMGELASFRRTELQTLKGFLTRKVDKFRPPHGRKTIESARRCVFFGTTNDKEFLPSGETNRRFKPVKVGKLNFEQLKKDREQLLAEAVWLYKNDWETSRNFELEGKAFEFESTYKIDKQIKNDSDHMAEEILGFINAEKKKPESERFPFKKFKVVDLFTGGAFMRGCLRNWRIDGRNLHFAGKALTKVERYYAVEKWRSKGVNYLKIDIACDPTPPMVHQNKDNENQHLN